MEHIPDAWRRAFRNREQLEAVCRVLTLRAELLGLWRSDGPMPAWSDSWERSQLPPGARGLCDVADAMSGADLDGAGVRVVLDGCDRLALRAVGRLMVAMSEGSDALDAWIVDPYGTRGAA